MLATTLNHATLVLDQPLNQAPGIVRKVKNPAPAVKIEQTKSTLNDIELVAHYRQAAEQYGPRSEEAALAFEPIFKRYWPQARQWAEERLGVLYGDELAGETMLTVLQRLNGPEDITYLRGLVRHSFECEYSTLMEKLFQGKKLARARASQPAQTRTTPSKSKPKLHGATLVSLNETAFAGFAGEDEFINLLPDLSPDSDVAVAASRRELIQVLHRLIEQMPPQYRAPLVAQWLRGLRIKEVAEELGLTVDQVKHNTARGMCWLRKHLPGEAQDWLIA